MPNHVTNIITYEGDRKQIAEMLEAIKNDELGIGTVDFQKIIPMPDDIYTGNFGPKERELYGDKNWYDWSRANWGTKWNCYGYEEGIDYSQTDSLWFQTAWSAPHPILQKLTEMFPEIEFKHQWADEDILYGHNMKNGSMFANVCRFKEKSYYDSHPYGWVYTSDAVYRLDFFSVAVTDWHDEIYNGYREVSEWIPRLKEISRIYENMELTEQDRLVLLSTCSYEFDNARTVLTGRLVEMEGDVNE